MLNEVNKRKKFILSLNPLIHRDFKTKCTYNGVTMNYILEILMKMYVNGEVDFENLQSNVNIGV